MDKLFDGEYIKENKALHVVDGYIKAITTPENIPAGARSDHISGCLSRGFFDIQVNGGGGQMLNLAPSPEGMAQIALAHRKLGTTALFPTVISDRAAVLESACAAIIEAHGQHGIMGLHIEGPHISEARRGTHLARFLRPLDAETIGQVRKLRDLQIPLLITLAPEAVAPGQIATLVEMGAIVSLGHSDADAQTTRRALNEGANAFTHLFNAMSPMLSRAPGMTGAAINSRAYCTFICDGIHVADEMLALAIRARPAPDHMVLISDAMPTVGGPDSFELYGRTVSLADGALRNVEGTLAGAHTSMAASLARLVLHVGVSLEQALRMATSNPARMMGLPAHTRLLGARLCDLIVLEQDLSCRLLCDS